MNADATACEQVRRFSGLAVHRIADTGMGCRQVVALDADRAGGTWARTDGQAAEPFAFVLRIAIYPCRSFATTAHDDAIDGQGGCDHRRLLVERVHRPLSVELLTPFSREEEAAKRVLGVCVRAKGHEQCQAAQSQSRGTVFRS